MSTTTSLTTGPTTSSRRWPRSRPRRRWPSRTPRTSRRWRRGRLSSSRSRKSASAWRRRRVCGRTGRATPNELRQLIDYHNVRVYRLEGEDLIPVAMQGQVGEYVDETPEQLMVKYGQGITGWVAEDRVGKNPPNAARDPRARTTGRTPRGP